MQIIFALTIFIIFAIWNGFVVIWGTSSNQQQRQNANKTWHKIAVLAKIAMILPVLYAYPYSLWPLILFTALNLGWTVYDLTINMIRHKAQGLKILHIDMMPFNSTAARILTPAGFWIVKFSLIAINIIWIWIIG